LAATRIKPSSSTSCGDQRGRRYMNWNDTCDARTVQKSGAIRTSVAIWWRCGRIRFQPAIRHQHGGRESGSQCGAANDKPTDHPASPRHERKRSLVYVRRAACFHPASCRRRCVIPVA
jgi:hypothetical protein